MRDLWDIAHACKLSELGGGGWKGRDKEGKGGRNEIKCKDNVWYCTVLQIYKTQKNTCPPFALSSLNKLTLLGPEPQCREWQSSRNHFGIQDWEGGDSATPDFLVDKTPASRPLPKQSDSNWLVSLQSRASASRETQTQPVTRSPVRVKRHKLWYGFLWIR